MNKNDFYLLYRKIYRLGYSRILIESGLSFLNNLLKNKVLQNLFIFKSDYKLGKNGSNNDTAKYLKALTTKLVKINLNGDKLFKKEFNYV